MPTDEKCSPLESTKRSLLIFWIEANSSWKNRKINYWVNQKVLKPFRILLINGTG